MSKPPGKSDDPAEACKKANPDDNKFCSMPDWKTCGQQDNSYKEGEAGKAEIAEKAGKAEKTEKTGKEKKAGSVVLCCIFIFHPRTTRPYMQYALKSTQTVKQKHCKQ